MMKGKSIFIVLTFSVQMSSEGTEGFAAARPDVPMPSAKSPSKSRKIKEEVGAVGSVDAAPVSEQREHSEHLEESKDTIVVNSADQGKTSSEGETPSVSTAASDDAKWEPLSNENKLQDTPSEVKVEAENDVVEKEAVVQGATPDFTTTEAEAQAETSSTATTVEAGAVVLDNNIAPEPVDDTTTGTAISIEIGSTVSTTVVSPETITDTGTGIEKVDAPAPIFEIVPKSATTSQKGDENVNEDVQEEKGGSIAIAEGDVAVPSLAGEADVGVGVESNAEGETKIDAAEASEVQLSSESISTPDRLASPVSVPEQQQNIEEGKGDEDEDKGRSDSPSALVPSSGGDGDGNGDASEVDNNSKQEKEEEQKTDSIDPIKEAPALAREGEWVKKDEELEANVVTDVESNSNATAGVDGGNCDDDVSLQEEEQKGKEKGEEKGEEKEEQKQEEEKGEEKGEVRTASSTQEAKDEVEAFTISELVNLDTCADTYAEEKEKDIEGEGVGEGKETKTVTESEKAKQIVKDLAVDLDQAQEVEKLEAAEAEAAAQALLSPIQRTIRKHASFLQSSKNLTLDLNIIEAVTFFRKKLSQIANDDSSASSSSSKSFIDDMLAEQGLVECFVSMLLLRGFDFDSNPSVNANVSEGEGKECKDTNMDKDVPNHAHTLQFELAWILSNIAAGTHEQTQAVYEHGALEAFLQVLRNSNTHTNVCGQLILAIGNVAGDSAEGRDRLLTMDVVGSLLAFTEREGFYTKNHQKEILRRTAWALCNLCRGKPAPDISHIKNAIPIFQKMLNSKDGETMVDAAWGLGYICHSDLSIELVLNSGVMPLMVMILREIVTKSSGMSGELLGMIGGGSSTITGESSISDLELPLMRVLANLASAEDASLVDPLLKEGIIKPLVVLSFSLRQKNVSFRKEACFALSNITAGTKQQIQLAIDEGVFGSELICFLESNLPNDIVVQKEATYLIWNVLDKGSLAQCHQLFELGMLAPLCLMLDPTKLTAMRSRLGERSLHEIVHILLKSIAAFLRAGKAEVSSTANASNSTGGKQYISSYAEAIDQCGGRILIDKIAHEHNSSLQHEDSNALYAQKILDTYFDHH